MWCIYLQDFTPFNCRLWLWTVAQSVFGTFESPMFICRKCRFQAIVFLSSLACISHYSLSRFVAISIKRTFVLLSFILEPLQGFGDYHKSGRQRYLPSSPSSSVCSSILYRPSTDTHPNLYLFTLDWIFCQPICHPHLNYIPYSYTGSVPWNGNRS